MDEGFLIKTEQTVYVTIDRNGQYEVWDDDSATYNGKEWDTESGPCSSRDIAGLYETICKTFYPDGLPLKRGSKWELKIVTTISKVKE